MTSSAGGVVPPRVRRPGPLLRGAGEEYPGVALEETRHAGHGLDRRRPLAGSARATGWHVRQDGTGDFATIAAALAVAVPGDSVYVGAGEWYEHGLNVKKGVDLVSESDDPALRGGVAGTLDVGEDQVSVPLRGGARGPSRPARGGPLARRPRA
jgi:hypothetical protein